MLRYLLPRAFLLRAVEAEFPPALSWSSSTLLTRCRCWPTRSPWQRTTSSLSPLSPYVCPSLFSDPIRNNPGRASAAAAEVQVERRRRGFRVFASLSVSLCQRRSAGLCEAEARLETFHPLVAQSKKNSTACTVIFMTLLSPLSISSTCLLRPLRPSGGHLDVITPATCSSADGPRGSLAGL